MTTYVFPGQGSQAKGMGGDLFSEFPDLVQKANDILGYSITSLCLEGPANLNITSFTQPALFVVSALTYLKKAKETGNKPNYVAGHSLGEYSALFAAGVFDFETGLKLVQKRGALMAEASGGKMAAVVGLKSDDVQAVLQKNNLSTLNIANYNTFTQNVISGPMNDIEHAKPIFEAAGAMFIPLNVSGAFHSPLMEPAKQQFANFLNQFSFSTPTIPVIANVNAKPYENSEIQMNLANQITSPVCWTRTIEFLINKGESSFEEIGPGNVLTGLIKRIQKGQ